MQKLKTFRANNVLVYGMGVTGRSVIETLHPLGVSLSLYVDGVLSEEDRCFLDGYSPAIERLEAVPTAFVDYDFVLRASGIAADRPLIQQARAQGVEVITDLELAYRLFGGERMIAITGSNGKTTVTSLLEHVLCASGRHAFACGNIGRPLLTTLAEGPDDGDYVVECSSFQLEGVKTFAPHRAALLNLSPDHIEWHGSFDAYADAKAQIAHRQSADDHLWIPEQDAAIADALRRVPTTAGVHRLAFDAPLLDDLRRGRGWQLFGEHNVENAGFVLAMARDMGLSTEEIAAAFATFRPIAHRMEHVGEVGGVTFINDSKGTNVDATVRALSGITQPVILIAGGYDKHVSFDALYEAFRAHGKTLIVMGETAPLIADGARKAGLGEALIVTHTLEEAFHSALGVAESGDMVLLSPASASWDQYRHFEERGDEFRDLVGAWRAQWETQWS